MLSPESHPRQSLNVGVVWGTLNPEGDLGAVPEAVSAGAGLGPSLPGSQYEFHVFFLLPLSFLKIFKKLQRSLGLCE